MLEKGSEVFDNSSFGVKRSFFEDFILRRIINDDQSEVIIKEGRFEIQEKISLSEKIPVKPLLILPFMMIFFGILVGRGLSNKGFSFVVVFSAISRQY